MLLRAQLVEPAEVVDGAIEVFARFVAGDRPPETMSASGSTAAIRGPAAASSSAKASGSGSGQNRSRLGSFQIS